MLKIEISQEQKTSSEELLNIISVFEQIGEKLKLIIESSDPSKYKIIIDSIFRYLNYTEIESLLDSIKDNSNWPVFLAEFSKEKHKHEGTIESFYLHQVEEARLSLCTSDFMAYIIGKKCDLQVLFNDNSIWSEVYTKINTELNGYLIREKVLCIGESNRKAHVPINYALSMFFLHDKKTAASKFKTILDKDRKLRLEGSYEAEYFLVVEKFFDRLKLDYIPQIINLYQLEQDFFENKKYEYVTREEIMKIVNKRDYFNNNPFKIDSAHLLTQNNIKSNELLFKLIFLYFEQIGSKNAEKDTKVLISCFTENHPSFDKIEINNTRVSLNQYLVKNNKIDEFIYYIYYLTCRKILIDSKNKLSNSIPEFLFKPEGMSKQKITDILSNRDKIEKAFETKLPNDLFSKAQKLH